jgi:bifunctional enzyme CysN/CysC
MDFEREQMNIVIVGHVDHGKSTVIGRLLADTGSLPQGKLEQIRRNCELNAKPFEYAFLLDALKDEQAQGITIDTARCFFKTAKRHYIIIDAPGHIEFLKNMISGAARAEAALLVIDANEGIRENSRRHGFMLSLLGISQIVVLVNKMDLADYRQAAFEQIKTEFTAFLKEIKVEPRAFVPISAREGDNLTGFSKKMPWYQGPTTLDLIDSFTKERLKEEQPLRFPVQDIYKFTEDGDDRRIIAGTVETGSVKIGDEVIFLPSQKQTVIQSIEGFNQPLQTVVNAGYPAGFTVKTQIYIKPGEMMCRVSEPPAKVGSVFRANIFWMGKHPLVQGKKYKLKIATNRASVYLKQLIKVLDASDLTVQVNPGRVNRNDVAECILQTIKPIAYDLSSEIETTGRFVMIDDYEIVGGGIIIESIADYQSMISEHVARREYAWAKSSITPADRAARFSQKPKFIVISGGEDHIQEKLAKALEEDLFKQGHSVYYLGITNLSSGLDSDVQNAEEDREEHIRRLGELAHIFTDAGQIFISNIPGLDEAEIEVLKILNEPNEILVVNLGINGFENYPVALNLNGAGEIESSIHAIKKMLQQKEVLLEYYI